MTDTDTKLKREAEWIKAHTLSPEQTKVLIQNKLRRAAEMHSAYKSREALCKRK